MVKKLLDYGLAWLFYLVILCYLFSTALAHHDFSGTTLDWSWTITDILRLYQGNDIGIYATGGYELYKDGHFSKDSINQLRWVAPGMHYLFAGALVLQGEQGMVLPVLSAVNIAFWSLLLLIAYEALRGRIPRLGAFTLPLAIFLLPEMHHFVLHAGVMNSDAYGTTLLAAGFIALWLAFEHSSTRWAIISGIAFAASAYMRSNHEQLFKLQLIAFALLTIVEYRHMHLPAAIGWRNKCRQFFLWASTRANLKLGFMILATAFVTMLPWRMHNLITDHRMSWAGSVSMEFRMTWQQLDPKHWYYVSGGTVACRIAPDICQGFYARGINEVGTDEKARAFFRTLITHPLQWYGIKLTAFYTRWVERYGEHNSVIALIFQHWLLLLTWLLPAAGIYRYYQQPTFRNVGFCWAGLSLYFYLFIILTFAHIEARYLFPIKSVVFYWSLLEIAAWFQRHKTNPFKQPIQ